MNTNTNLYEILAIHPNATQAELKKAYHKQALIYHPDRNKSPDAENKFKEISFAFSVLSDDEKRARYDEFGIDGIASTFDIHAARREKQRQQNPFGSNPFGSNPFTNPTNPFGKDNPFRRDSWYETFRQKPQQQNTNPTPEQQANPNPNPTQDHSHPHDFDSYQDTEANYNNQVDESSNLDFDSILGAGVDFIKNAGFSFDDIFQFFNGSSNHSNSQKDNSNVDDTKSKRTSRRGSTTRQKKATDTKKRESTKKTSTQQTNTQQDPPKQQAKQQATQQDQSQQQATQPNAQDIEIDTNITLAQAIQGGSFPLNKHGVVEIKLPSNIVHGQKIRLKGKGLNGGDLKIKINIVLDSEYRMDGDDIFYETYLPLSKVVYGSEIEIPDPETNQLIKIRVPQGFDTSKKMRVSSKGMPKKDGSRGSLFVKVYIKSFERSVMDNKFLAIIKKLEDYESDE